MPSEEVGAISRTREFLESLLDSKKTPRVSKAVRDEAHGCLKHYPFECHEPHIRLGLEEGLKMQSIIEMWDELGEDTSPQDAWIAAADKLKKMRSKEGTTDVHIDISDDEFNIMARAAHRENMSVNDWASLAITETLEEYLH